MRATQPHARGHDRIWQAFGLLVGVYPAIMFAYGLIIGMTIFVVVAGIGTIWPRFRSFFYGMMCSVLMLPGLLVGALLVTS